MKQAKTNQESISETVTRDDRWLADKMYDLWEDHFEDVPRVNKVLIKFSKKSKRQLGAIGWLQNRTKKIDKLLKESEPGDDSRVSLINITSYFKEASVPEYVVLGTIAHEMCHYAHGFNSPLKQIYDHPHKGGVIRKEMTKRGLSDIYKKSRIWLKENWRNFLILKTKSS